MNEEEIIRKNLKKLSNNIFSKLNDVEKSYLLMVNNEKNKQINELQQELQRKDNIINEIERYFFKELQSYGGGGIAEENYKKIIELKEK